MYSWSGVSHSSIIRLSCILIIEVIARSQQKDPAYCCPSEEWNPVWPVLSPTWLPCAVGSVVALTVPLARGKSHSMLL